MAYGDKIQIMNHLFIINKPSRECNTYRYSPLLLQKKIKFDSIWFSAMQMMSFNIYRVKKDTYNFVVNKYGWFEQIVEVLFSSSHTHIGTWTRKSGCVVNRVRFFSRRPYFQIMNLGTNLISFSYIGFQYLNAYTLILVK